MSDLLAALEYIPAAIIAVIVISNPVSTSAMFLMLTEGRPDQEKLRIAINAARYSLLVLLFFAITGLLLFQIFGFSVGAFRIAGGVLLMGTALEMLNPKPPTEVSASTPRDITLFPLSIPIISGPGTIVTVVVLMSGARDMGAGQLEVELLATAGVFIAIFVLILASYLAMIHSDRIFSLLKDEGRKAATKLLGLIVLSIAIQFIINGIGDVLPGYWQILNDAANGLL